MKMTAKITSEVLFLLSLIAFSSFAACEDEERTEAEINQDDVNLVDFENNDSYFIRNIDVNQDGALDKVVSSSKNSGNDLYFFENKSGVYTLALKSIKFSEDGGRIIDDVVPDNDNDNVAIVKTFFPKGYDLASYYIVYDNNDWVLKKTIFENINWQNNPDVIYICEAKQDIPMRQLLIPEIAANLKQIPDEADREHVCAVRKRSPQ